MQVKNETRTKFGAEIKVVPTWAWVLAGMVFMAAQIFFNVLITRHTNAPPPPWARPLLGLLAGAGGACWLLFIGYINRDAKRRGMSSLLWTIMAIIIPNALGIILYFLLRKSVQSACPQCGHAVRPGFNFCPQCNCKLSPSCPQCQRLVEVGDVYCPYCGTPLRDQGTAGLPTTLPGTAG
jgi:RNA polymerase subunit RPABC4/transcription elongation factor Spt4